MNREFRRDLNNNYMILSDSTINSMDDYRVRMLISNHIPFVLKCNVRKFDGTEKYYYEITSKHPMNLVFDKKTISKNELNIIIASFLKVLDSCSEYLLNPDDFILEPDYIYMNIETNQIYFCYMPGYGKDIGKSFHELTAYILERINHDEKHTVATAYELYRQTMNDNYSLRNILNSITEEEDLNEGIKQEELEMNIDTKVSPISPEENVESEKKVPQVKEKKTPLFVLGGFVIVVALAFLGYFLYINLPLLKSSMSNELLMKIGGVLVILIVVVTYSIYKKSKSKVVEKEDNLIIVEEKERYISKPDYEIRNEKARVEKVKTLPSYHTPIVTSNAVLQEEPFNYGNTVLLNYRAPVRKLISTNEKYPSFELHEKSFLIGKMQEHVDGIVQDELVSRIHAEVKTTDSRYFLTDLNSTNGTFHNNRRLEANETVEIYPEDSIRFATVEYIFR